MTAVDVTTAELVLALVWWLAALVALWRWPGLTLGLAAALGLWTVAPWVAWLALVAVGAAAVAWRRSTGGHRLCWPGVRWLARRPALAVLVVSAGVAALGPDPLGPLAFVVLVAAAGLLAWTWPTLDPGPEPAGTVVAEQPPSADRSVVVSGPCGRCGGVLVAEARHGSDPAELVARAACGRCGLRLVGVVDPARPGVGLVWFELPDGVVPR